MGSTAVIDPGNQQRDAMSTVSCRQRRRLPFLQVVRHDTSAPVSELWSSSMPCPQPGECANHMWIDLEAVEKGVSEALHPFGPWSTR